MSTRRARFRSVLLVLGILFPQVCIFAPSLFGGAVFLPLDIMRYEVPALYSETAQPVPRTPPDTITASDMTEVYEPFRRFAVDELRAGRLPLWNPYSYCGSDFLGAGQSALFSPYRLIDFASPDPRVLAWAQLAKALVAGLGMYFFLRRGMRLPWIAGAAGAWVYPLSGFLTAWASYPLAAGATWLPWMLFATQMLCRSPRLRWPALLAAVTACCCFAGHFPIFAHMLLMTGLYLLWRTWPWFKPAARAAIARCVAGWALGLLLAGPQLFPLVNYVTHSHRFALRSAGTIERPSMGIAALPLIVDPWFAGEVRPGTMFLLTNNRRESLACAYAGLCLLFVAVPFAWRFRRWRGAAFFWLAVAVFGVGQILGIPILKQIEESPPLGMLSSNRLSSLAAFALTILGAIGIAALSRKKIPDARLRWLPLLAPAALAIHVLWRLINRYELITPVLDAIAHADGLPEYPHALMLRIVDWFALQYAMLLALVLLAGVLFALLTRLRTAPAPRRLVVALLVVICVAEAAAMAWPGMPQIDRRWYPQNPPIIARLKQLPPGRIVGADTLKPNYNMLWSLEDARGYDAADPLRMTQLMLRAGEPAHHASEAALLNWKPANLNVLNMLNVRYVITPQPEPGAPPPVLSGDRLYVYENPNALPRVFVPGAVQLCNDPEQRLNTILSPGFSPGELALIEGEAAPTFEHAQGSAEITQSLSCEVKFNVDMKTPGMAVLADSFAPGWTATYQGAPTPIYCVDHALRGVALPAGKGEVVMRYQPAPLRWGIAAMLAALLVIGVGLSRRIVISDRINRIANR